MFSERIPAVCKCRGTGKLRIFVLYWHSTLRIDLCTTYYIGRPNVIFQLLQYNTSSVILRYYDTAAGYRLQVLVLVSGNPTKDTGLSAVCTPLRELVSLPEVFQYKYLFLPGSTQYCSTHAE